MFLQEKITSLVELFGSEGKSLDEKEATAEFDKLWNRLLSDIQDYSFKRIEQTNFEMHVQEYLIYNRNIFSHVIFERTDSLNQSIWIVLEDIIGGPISDISVVEVLQNISDASKQNVVLKMETMKPYLKLTTGHGFA
ncbi:hypothetical protein QYM36_018386, partial [Artemia franciscana]